MFARRWSPFDYSADPSWEAASGRGTVYSFSIVYQAPYAAFPQGPGGLPVSDAKADLVIALPMHAYLTPDVQDRIIEAVSGYNG